MNHPLKNPQWLLPVIRKVIRRDGAFICSICRTEYASSGEANGCLNQCWYEIRNFYPVVKRRGLNQKTIYRCQYCCRDYDFETEALACAQACSSDRNKLHIREQMVNDLPVDIPAKRTGVARLSSQAALGKRLRRQIENEVLSERRSDGGDSHDISIDTLESTDTQASYRSSLESSKAQAANEAPPALSQGKSKPAAEATRQEPKSSAEVTKNTPVAKQEASKANTANGATAAVATPATPAKASDKSPAPTPPSEATAAPAEKVNKGRHKNSFSKQWSRQDAKYQCRYCNKRFYTKQEVEDCFHSHFNEDGYETIVGAGPAN